MILVVGDAMIDRYSYIEHRRNSPEDPDIPVWDIVKTVDKGGGALNMAANLGSLYGENVHFSGIFPETHVFPVKIVSQGVGTDNPIIKQRIIDNSTGKQICRIDNLETFDDWDLDVFSTRFEFFRSDYEAVVISDYCKGTITDKVIQIIADMRIPTFVDTKRKDLTPFGEIEQCFVKINSREFGLIGNFEMVNLIVTYGGAGAAYYPKTGLDEWVEGTPIEPPEMGVVGAGDAYLAGFVTAFMQEMGIENSMRYADLVARASVRKPGTSIVTLEDVEQEMWHDYHGHAG